VKDSEGVQGAGLAESQLVTGTFSTFAKAGEGWRMCRVGGGGGRRINVAGIAQGPSGQCRACLIILGSDAL